MINQSEQKDLLSVIQCRRLDNIIPQSKRFTNQKIVDNFNNLIRNSDVIKRTGQVDVNYKYIICKGDKNDVKKLMTIQEYEIQVNQQMTTNFQNQNQDLEVLVPYKPIQDIVKAFEQSKQYYPENNILEDQKILAKYSQNPDYQKLEKFQNNFRVYLPLPSSVSSWIVKQSSTINQKTTDNSKKIKQIPIEIKPNLIKKVASYVNETMEKTTIDDFFQRQKFQNFKNNQNIENEQKIKICGKLNIVLHEEPKATNVLFGKNGNIYLDKDGKISSTKTSDSDQCFQLYKIYEQKFLREWSEHEQIFMGKTYGDVKDRLVPIESKAYSHIFRCYLYMLRLINLVDEIYFWIRKIEQTLNPQQAIEVQRQTGVLRIIADKITYPKEWVEMIIGSKLDKELYAHLIK